jgi:hypothetical protein
MANYMPEPITGAIAGSVASVAIKEIVNYIEESEDPEEAWKRSILEVAIQAEAFYRQEVVAGRLYDPDKIQRRMNDFGELAQQLAIRGEVRGYDEGFVELVRDLGNGCGDFADRPGGTETDPSDDWEDMVESPLSQIKSRVDI